LRNRLYTFASYYLIITFHLYIYLLLIEEYFFND
jgi:hypothetical protein